MKLLHLSIALFSLSVVLLYATERNQSVSTIPNTSNAQDFVQPTIPSHTTTQPPLVTAQGVYIVDTATQTVLYQKDAEKRLAPASTTKMMTALIASEVYDPNMIVTVPFFTVDGQKMKVFAGERISVESLLYGTLVDSANDAAEVFSRIYPGGREAFISYMNTKAKALGMMNTTFQNPTGLDDPLHESTAHDMAILGGEIMRQPALRQIVGTTSASVTSANGKFTHYFKATNMLLTTVPGVEGIKTGWTEAAHENLVTYVNRDHHPIIIALLGSDDRFGETKSLIEWIYGSTAW